MGVKRTIQVWKPWGCSKSAITPQQMLCLPWNAKKEDIFTCWGWWILSKTCFIGRGKGWRYGKQEFDDPLVASRWCFRNLGDEAAAAAGLGKPSGRSGDIPCPGSPQDVHHQGWWQELPLVGVLRLWKALSFCQTLLLHNIFPVVLLSKYSLSSSVSPLQSQSVPFRDYAEKVVSTHVSNKTSSYRHDVVHIFIYCL